MFVPIYPDHVNYKIAALVPGQLWDLRPDNPVPDGWIMDKDHRLFPLGAVGAGAGASWDSHAASLSAEADRIIREETARGWSPGARVDRVPCGGCSACRSGESRRCLRPLAGAAAVAEKARRDRARVDQALVDLYNSYEHASAMSIVESSAVELERRHQLAERDS
jgi:hypothetical protein